MALGAIPRCMGSRRPSSVSRPCPQGRELYPLPLVQTCLVPLVSKRSVCTGAGRGCVCLFKQMFVAYLLCARHRVGLNNVTSFVLAPMSC